MLEGGGNPWRGMIYGITNRAGWVGNTPVEIWKFWDEYNITDKPLTGYWEKNYPVKSSNGNVFTSLFKGDKESILAVANWSDMEQTVSLNVSWDIIGIDQSKAEIYMPEIKNFQNSSEIVKLNDLRIPAKKGFLIIIRSK
jgi:hypothetical protein